MAKAPIVIDPARARHIWIAAQRLDRAEPFGAGAAATSAAIAHLGYVQIDTINVIERCHHHILWSRIPGYKRADLSQVQSVDRSVFEYWTHALSYVPVTDLPFFLPAMKQYRETPSRWFGSVTAGEVKAMRKRLADGPLSIRDIGDDELVEKTHLWGSRKPSKRVLEMMFFQGLVTVGGRQGMLKTYDLMKRHFGDLPKAATERQVASYKLDRALRSQGLVSLDSICHLDAPGKKAVKAAIDTRVRGKELVAVTLADSDGVVHWARPETLESWDETAPSLVHILSPFDPLIIQRKRLSRFFGYDHLFEAYVPAAKRKLGYFALPILLGDRIIAAFDLKTDRKSGKLLIQQASWFEDVGAEGKSAVDAALDRFEQFQLAE